jgi:hypothetical protein
MPFLWSAARVTQSKGGAARGRGKAPDVAPLDLPLGLPTFLGNDLEAMRTAARQNLELFTTFPVFQRLFRAMGYTDEAALMERGGGQDALTDRLLDVVCLLGPVTRCREQLAAFRIAGVDMPILMPPMGVEAAHTVIQAFRR